MEWISNLKYFLRQNKFAKILLYIAALVEPVAVVYLFFNIAYLNSPYFINPYYVLGISFYACIILWWIYDEGSLQWMMNYLVSIVNVLIILIFFFIALIGGAFNIWMTLLMVVFPFAFPLAILTNSPLVVLIGCILITAAIGFWRYRKKSGAF